MPATGQAALRFDSDFPVAEPLTRYPISTTATLFFVQRRRPFAN